MKTRIITGIVLGIVIIPLVVIAGIPFLILGIILSMVASFEMMNMFYTKSEALKIVRFVVPVLTVILTSMVWYVNVELVTENPSVFANQFWLVVVFLCCIVVITTILIFTKQSTAHDIANSIMALCYTGLIIGYVISIRYLTPVGTSEYFETNFWGGRTMAYLFIIVVCTDTFAYFFGCRFGKHQLCPEISPKKSVEGAIAGTVFGSIAGVVSAFVMNIIKVDNLKTAIITAIVIFFISMFLSIMAQVGDLVASKFKRTYEIKDFGKIFPGHGGVLDRFDSMIWAGACLYIITQIIQLGLLNS